MADFKNLSTEAKIGKILIIVGIILDIISTVIIFTGGFYFSIGLTISGLFGRFALVLGLINLLGLILGVYAYKLTSAKNFHKAGLYAIIASLLPPLDIFMLIGGILCLVCEEAKKA